MFVSVSLSSEREESVANEPVSGGFTMVAPGVGLLERQLQPERRVVRGHVVGRVQSAARAVRARPTAPRSLRPARRVGPHVRYLPDSERVQCRSPVAHHAR